jgi:hypothetical protein
MKSILFLSICFLVKFFARAQGTLIYDQGSQNLIEGSAPWSSSYQPMGQSFTPLLSALGFIQLNVYDADVLNTSGSTLLVNIRANSITGTVLGQSAAISIPDGFSGIATFLFSTPVMLTPGTVYYIQPVQSGDNVASYVTDSYAGGAEILQGSPIVTRDLWFREGIVPEPSSASLLVIGAGILFRRLRSRK